MSHRVCGHSFQPNNLKLMNYIKYNLLKQHPPMSDWLYNGKRKSLEDMVPMLMHMTKNRHLCCPTGPVSPAIHDIKNIHVTITIP